MRQRKGRGGREGGEGDNKVEGKGQYHHGCFPLGFRPVYWSLEGWLSCLVRPGRRLPVQGLSEGSLGFRDRLPGGGAPGPG